MGFNWNPFDQQNDIAKWLNSLTAPAAPKAPVGSYGKLSSGPYSTTPTGGGVMYQGQEIPNYPGYYWNSPAVADIGTTGGATPSTPAYPYDPNAPSSETAMSEYQRKMWELAQQQLAEEQYQFRNPQSQAISAYQQQQLANQQQQSQQELAYQQQQLAAEQAWRTQQLEAEKQQRLATLAAQPKSWLEYASLANQAPVVQPWMLPLMPQDYMQSQPVGSPISGWTPENMKGMPDLINPSAQMRARMGPTALQQYYGYQQADQGMTPEESQFRLWSQGPPGGSYRGLTQQR